MTSTRKMRPGVRLRLTAPARKTPNSKRGIKGSRVGDDLVEAFEKMARRLRGEIKVQAYELPNDALSPTQIKAIRLFGIPARTMEAYQQGRRNPDGAMRALLRIIDREPKAALRALAA